MEAYFLAAGVLAALTFAISVFIWWLDKSWVSAEDLRIFIVCVLFMSAVWPVGIVVLVFLGGTEGIAWLMNRVVAKRSTP